MHLPGERIGHRERMERAEAQICPTDSFPTLMLRPGLEPRETRGTRRLSIAYEMGVSRQDPAGILPKGTLKDASPVEV